MLIYVFRFVSETGQTEQLQPAQYVRVFALRRRMRRMHRLESLHRIIKLGTPDDYTGALAGRYRMPPAGRVLHVEIRTLESNYIIHRNSFRQHVCILC